MLKNRKSDRVLIGFVLLLLACWGCQQRVVYKPLPQATEVRLDIESNAEGVSVVESGNVLWVSVPNQTKNFAFNRKISRITLSKLCYSDKQIQLDYSTSNTAKIIIHQDEWEKYAYLRINYLEGDTDAIRVTDIFADPVVVNPGGHVTKKIELGEYDYTIYSHYSKEPKSGRISICQEDEIYMLSASTKLPDENIIVLSGINHPLKHGYGAIKFLCAAPNSTVSIQSNDNLKTDKVRKEVLYILQGKETVEIPFASRMVIKAPTIIQVPSGNYTITYNRKQERFDLYPNDVKTFNLDTF